MYFASIKPRICFSHSKKKKKICFGISTDSWSQPADFLQKQTSERSSIKKSSGGSLSHLGLLQSWAQTLQYQKETLIPSSNEKVFLTLSLQMVRCLSVLPEEKLSCFPSVRSQLRCLCLFWRGPPSSRLWYTLLQWDRLLKKPSRMHSQMDSIWPDWIGFRIHALGVSVDVHLSFPLVV